jgi:hypothetical protein
MPSVRHGGNGKPRPGRIFQCLAKTARSLLPGIWCVQHSQGIMKDAGHHWFLFPSGIMSIGGMMGVRRSLSNLTASDSGLNHVT